VCAVVGMGSALIDGMKTTVRTPKIDAVAAEQCGRIAFQEGRMRAPIVDPTYRNELLAKYLGHDEYEPMVKKARHDLAYAFLRGWDQENLAT